MAKKIEVPVSDDLLNQIDLDGFQKVIIYYPDRATSEKIAEKYQREFSEREKKSKDYMDLQTTCSYMDISYLTLRKWINSGLRVITIDAKRYIAKDSLIEFLKDHET